MIRAHLFGSRRAFARQLLAVAGAGLALACAPAPAHDDAQAAQPAGDPGPMPILVIDHVEPRRDVVGPQPARFVWTAAAGADRYAIGIWNEVDRLLWRRDDVAGTTVDRPAGFDLEPGTYFWSVTGLKNGREIARSGQAAFVVE